MWGVHPITLINVLSYYVQIIDGIKVMPRHIELNLRDLDQLFNTIDPSPFKEKDLDRDAEDFILSWAQEFPLNEPIDLTIHLTKIPDGDKAKQLVQESVHNLS
jgi:hypothetical protein